MVRSDGDVAGLTRAGAAYVAGVINTRSSLAGLAFIADAFAVYRDAGEAWQDRQWDWIWSGDV